MKGLQRAHIGVVLSRPLVPAVYIVHLHGARRILITDNTLKRTLTLKLDCQRIREIDDPIAQVFLGMYRKIAFCRIVLPRCTAPNTSTETIHSPTPTRTDLRRRWRSTLRRK